ncbi:MAG: hypothetical protein C0490_08945 [Marivirga sp.]|nr:hypothetical protein [Marivirga sp.]
MNLPGITAISVIVILSGTLLSYIVASIQSKTRHEPTFLKGDFAKREKEKGISAAGSVFWILLLFLTVIILVGM